MDEKVTPVSKPVPRVNGLNDGGNSILTTPKKDTNGRYWGSKESKGSIMKK